MAIGSSGGLLLAGSASSITTVYFAYGIVFGAANGLGYGYALQLSGQITDQITGQFTGRTAGNGHALGMSLVTAFYAVGAACASPLFQITTQAGGNKLTLTITAAVIFFVCAMASLVTKITAATFTSEPAGATREISGSQKHLRLMMWLAYGTAVTAGLMVIGHAYPILSAKHPTAENAAISPLLVAAGNILGGLSIGYLTLKLSHKAALLIFSAISFIGLCLVAVPLASIYTMTLTGLVLIGFSYGAIIALYPVVVADFFGKQSSARIYGQIFTAWGLAGLTAPTLSGVLFDSTGSYTISLLLAIMLCVLTMVIIARKF